MEECILKYDEENEMTQATQTHATDHLLFTSTLSGEGFATFVRAYRVPTCTFMMLEEQPRRVVKQEERKNLLRFEHFDPNFNLTSYTSGRIFHEQGELLWERHQANVQIVYTGHTAWQPDLLPTTQPSTLNAYTLKDREYLLFGKRLDSKQHPSAQAGDFAEVRIPRLLHYPHPPELANKDRLRLVVCEYIDSATAVTVAYRFKGFPRPKEDAETTGVK